MNVSYHFDFDTVCKQKNVESCHVMRSKSRHVSTNIIVLLANCMLLCEQFRQCFVPSAVIYVPLGAKSS